MLEWGPKTPKELAAFEKFIKTVDAFLNLKVHIVCGLLIHGTNNHYFLNYKPSIYGGFFFKLH